MSLPDPRLKFENIGPIRVSVNNKIGEITEYHHNYEFSMEIKHKGFSGVAQVLQGMFEKKGLKILVILQGFS